MSIYIFFYTVQERGIRTHDVINHVLILHVLFRTLHYKALSWREMAMVAFEISIQYAGIVNVANNEVSS